MVSRYSRRRSLSAAAAQSRVASSVLPGRCERPSSPKVKAPAQQPKQLVTLNKDVDNLTGRLLYSTEEGGLSHIRGTRRGAMQHHVGSWQMAPSPHVKGADRWLAFHSTRPGAMGIALKDMSASTDPNVRERQLTTAPEDAQDAPPWAGTLPNSRLVFGSSETGSWQSRIYLIDVNGQAGLTSPVGWAVTPAWHPTQERIVYNGFSPTGGNPGLWLANCQRNHPPRQFTDNGNDIRPVWDPDGRTIVFMSNRSGNWDLYRVDVNGR